ncbi:hypothetical protein [Bacteriovorax sp. Seq25_V]|uniref:hypothetical protein n=1 Tax=Bacteriovorax sp. Seq25_V TaxID=1201288 RepID=UPI0012FBCF23|nr:hypothetical protein [Bacteriovorax sp. Seq25_V]
MKSKLFSTLILFHLFAYAELPNGQIQALNANYNSPTGTGTAKYINIDEFGEYRNPQLEVENYNGTLMFSIEDKSFELDLSMLGVSDAQTIGLNNLNFSNNSKNIALNFSSAKALDDDFSFSVSNPSVDCTRTGIFDDIKTDLLSNCLKYSKLRISRLDFRSDTSEFTNLITEEEITSSKIDLSDFKLDINSGKFKGEVKSSMSQGLTIKVEGLSQFKVESNQIEIKLDKAKAGIFNIKSKIFDELEKMDSDTISVREPYITIQLK